jgi:hypothetical protein
MLWTALLVHATYPLHGRLTQLFGGRDTLSAAVLTIGTLTIVVAPLIVTGVLLVRETRAAEQEIRAWIVSGGLERLPQQVAAVPVIGAWLRTLLSIEGLREISMEQTLIAGATFLSQFFVDQMDGLPQEHAFVGDGFFHHPACVVLSRQRRQGLDRHALRTLQINREEYHAADKPSGPPTVASTPGAP